jgi:Rrf2 family transcriptional regulator, nitric oxide-sensitive transcriptional repressor
MILSQTAEYALRAMAYLAEQGDNCPIPPLAVATHVPPDYLAKVMQALTQAGLVRARRGRNGGYALAKPAAHTNVLEVINAVDPIRRITSCPLGLPHHAVRLCSLHRRLDAAAAHLEQAFGTTSLADLVEEPIFDEGPDK